MTNHNNFAAVDALLDWKIQQEALNSHQAAIFGEAYYQIEAYRGRSYFDIQRAIAATAIEAMSVSEPQEHYDATEAPTVFLVTKYEIKSGRMIA